MTSRRHFLHVAGTLGIASAISELGCRSAKPAAKDAESSPPKKTKKREEPADEVDEPKTAPSASTKAVKKLPSLDTFLEQERNKSRIPALTAAIIANGDVVWTGAYGTVDIAKKLVATVDSIFYSASIGKTVTATGLMQLWEKGLFALDDDISAHLPMKVRNPKHPTEKITFRHLLTHTSSIADSSAVDDFVGEGDSAITMDTFMRGYLEPKGPYWSAENFSSAAPGKKYSYSNAGATLIGYLAERIGKKPFDSQCDERIFRPLKMEHTSWRLGGLPKGAQIALGYKEKAGGHSVLPRYGQDPAYPSGGLQTTVRDMSRFLAAYSKKGILDGARILEERTVAEMFKEQPEPAGEEGYGLIWYQKKFGPDLLTGHSGSYSGFNTEMWFRPSDGVGAVLFVNLDEVPDDFPEHIVTRMMKESASL